MYRTKINGIEVEVDTVAELQSLLDAAKAQPEPVRQPDVDLRSVDEEDPEPVALHSVPASGGRERIVFARPRHIDVLRILLAYSDEGISSRAVSELIDITHKSASTRLGKLAANGLARREGWLWWPTDAAIEADRIVAS